MSESNSERLIGLVNSAGGMDKLLAVMQALRDPNGGCPWDIEQTYQTILPFTIEEVYEVAESIEREDFDALKDELGDLLFQVVFYAQIAREEGRFDFYQVVESICDKLVRRHPHVFAESEFKNEEELKSAWEAQKHRERIAKDENKSSVLDDIPKALPELKRAQKIQKRVAKVGFDWECPEQVWEKVEEEIDETKSAFNSGDKKHLEEEIGDLLFAVVNLSRHYNVDADIALRKANQKFDQRFRIVEENADKPLAEYSLDELEELWQKAKISLDKNKNSV
ncbi:MAG: nucleoside triphosphate pyrophosphohydrolase [Kangiellaceae bacterium]|nr:nucleoside triphosphate pyrophosphohydrolase [Kangiellaceae bacterium]MCW9000413.1 nucleoside triphosphate pyrophosphohydrolase [Kangiellaceae bacterium]MCW9017724.1 nucleoside triphosphate pyrophosphohydrolase [Kangiellaceae bacterium]